MSCYFRHIADFLAEAGIVIDKENKKEIDRILHEYLGVEYKNCPAAWAFFKEHIRDDATARKKLINFMKKSRSSA